LRVRAHSFFAIIPARREQTFRPGSLDEHPTAGFNTASTAETAGTANLTRPILASD
jgi:hypothetical protein